MKTTSRLRGKYMAAAILVAGAIGVSSVHAAGGVDINGGAGLTAVMSSSSSSADAQVNTTNAYVDVSTNADVSAMQNSTATTSGDSAEAMTQLDSYVTTISSGNAAVSSVNTTSDSKVSVSYKRPAKLFGFIPVTVTETATVKADSKGKPSVSVKKSWWSFLASSEAKTKEFSTILQSRIDNYTAVIVSAGGKLSAADKQKYLAEISASEDAAYSYSGSDETSVNAY